MMRQDADGVVEFVEFKKLWLHLGGGHNEEHNAASPSFNLESLEIYPTFQKYDLNKKGYLSQYEVKKMMEALGYKVRRQDPIVPA
jgi:Ca2+-binding EF-hand superfamily protein